MNMNDIKSNGNEIIFKIYKSIDIIDEKDINHPFNWDSYNETQLMAVFSVGRGDDFMVEYAPVDTYFRAIDNPTMEWDRANGFMTATTYVLVSDGCVFMRSDVDILRDEFLESLESYERAVLDAAGEAYISTEEIEDGIEALYGHFSYEMPGSWNDLVNDDVENGYLDLTFTDDRLTATYDDGHAMGRYTFMETMSENEPAGKFEFL